MIEAFEAESDLGVRRKRARMRAWRRGMREMDLILGGFIDAHGETLDAKRLDSFEALLARRDQDLYAWISGRDLASFTGATEDETALLSEISANWRAIDKNLP